MKAGAWFITTLMTVDAFLIAYAAGFQSRHVPVIDPNLPPVQINGEAVTKKSEVPSQPEPKKATTKSVTTNKKDKTCSKKSSKETRPSKQNHTANTK